MRRSKHRQLTLIAAFAMSLVTGACSLGDRPSPATPAPSGASSAVTAASANAPALPSQSQLAKTPTTVPSPSARPSASTVPTARETTALHVTPDQTLLKMLPTRIGDIDLVGHVLDFGGVLPRDFSDDLGRALLAINQSRESDLSVAWVEATPEDAARNLGLTMLAMRLDGADTSRLRQVVVGDRAMIVGPQSRLSTESDHGAYVFVRNSLVGTAGDVVFLISFPVDLDLNVPPPDAIGWTQDELRAALPTVDPITRPFDRPSAFPTTGPHMSPRPDAATEALLPNAIRDVTLKKVSSTGAAIFSEPIDPLDPGAPGFALLPSALMASMLTSALDLDVADISTAAGYGDGLSTFFMTATRAPGLNSRLLTGAIVDDLAGQDSRTLETIDVDGQSVQLSDNLAIVAIDDVLYSMMYFDMGDTFGATFPPRPALHDLVIDAVRALP